MKHFDWPDIMAEPCLKCKSFIRLKTDPHPVTGYYCRSYITIQRDLVLYRICDACLPMKDSDKSLLPPKKMRPYRQINSDGSVTVNLGNTVYLFGADSSWGGSQCDERYFSELEWYKFYKMKGDRDETKT